MAGRGISIPLKLQNELTAGLDVAQADLKKFVDGAVASNTRLSESYKMAAKAAGESAAAAKKGSQEESAALKLQADYAKKAAVATGEANAVGSKSFISLGKNAEVSASKVTRLAGATQGLARNSAAFIAAYAGFEGLNGAIDQAEALEKAHASLGVVIKRNNGDVKEALPLIDKWAKAQAQFGISVTESEQGLSRATAMTGSVQAGMMAYNNALLISKATGKDFNAVLLAASKAQAGQTTALARYIGTIQKGTTPEQLHAMVQKRYAGQARANTSATDKFHAAISNMELTLGRKILPTVSKYLTAVANWIAKTKNQITVINALKPVFEGVVTVVEGLHKTFDFLYSLMKKVFGKETKTAIEVIGATIAIALGPESVAIIGAIYAIGLIRDNWAAIEKFFKKSWKTLELGFKLLWDGIKAGALDMVNYVVQKIASMADKILSVMSHIPFIGGKFKKAKEAVDQFAQHFQDKTDQAFHKIHDDWQKINGVWSTTVRINYTGAGARGPGGDTAPHFQHGPGGSGGGSGGHGGHGGHGGSGSAFGSNGTPSTKTAPDGQPINWQQFVGHHAGEDCSLFTQRAYKKLWNVSIPRTSEEQWHGGRPASGNAVGDLLFYNGHNRFKPPGHVALYIGNGQLIQDNGSGTVQIMPVDGLNSLGYMGARTYLSAGKAGQSGLPSAPGTSSSGPHHPTPAQKKAAAQAKAMAQTQKSITRILGISDHDVNRLTRAQGGAGTIKGDTRILGDERKVLKDYENEAKKLRDKIKHSSGKEKADYEKALKELEAKIAAMHRDITKTEKQLAKLAAEQAAKIKQKMIDDTVNALQDLETAADAAFAAQMKPYQDELNKMQQADTARTDLQSIQDAQRQLSQDIMLGTVGQIIQDQQALIAAQNQQTEDQLQDKITAIQNNEDNFNTAIEALIAHIQGDDPKSVSGALTELVDVVGIGSSTFAAVVAMLNGYLPDGSGTGAGTGGGTGGGTGDGTPHPSLGPPPKGGFKAFALGGLVTRPTYALIGEAGPEEVIPLSKAHAMGGTTINVTVNGVIATDLKRAAAELAPELRRELLRTKNRNGSLGF